MSASIDSGSLLSDLEARFAGAADSETRALLSATVAVEGVDPCAAVFGSRLASDRWFAWEEPEREFALAGLGSALEVVSRGAGRFREVAEECSAAASQAEGSDGLPAGAGAVWVGGFAFADHGAQSPTWSSFPPALMVMPELSICRVGGETHLTVNAVGGSSVDTDAALQRARARLAGLRAGALPMLDPQQVGRIEIESVRTPGEFESAVGAAVERIRGGGFEKVVLAREVLLRAPGAYDPGAVFGALRELFPACFCFCCGTAEAAFIGASPELLVRRSGAGVSTVALAGSARRSSDPSVDGHLGERLLQSAKDRGEHAIVVRRIVRSLRRHAVWVEEAPEPGLVKVANIQHLATPIHAQLAEPHSAIELAGLLHPTPAVGGEPWPAAAALIDELEEMDRGWYAGPVGWMDATEDGEFCVALRSALLRDREAHLFAGNGMVADSDPADELAETEVKLGAMLPLLNG